MGDIEVKGAEDFAALGKRLKEAGEKDLRRELYRGINRATKPIKEDVKKHVGEYVPAQYARILRGKLRLTTSKRAAGKNIGIVVRAKAASRLGPLDKGDLNHPVFGNRKVWRVTSVRPGFFSVEAKKGSKDAQKEILKAMQDVADKVDKK